MQPQQLDPHLAAQGGIEVRQRLVEQEHLRLAHDRPADGDALALAARQVLRPPLQIRFQLQDAGGLIDFPVAFGLGHPSQAQGESHVLADRHVRIQRIRLEHHRQPAIRRARPG